MLDNIRSFVDGPLLAKLLAIMAAIILLWDTPIVYPLRLLVVFFHELSHGVAALATGGKVKRIQLTGNEGGQCLTEGGWPFVILSAGYLGSMVWGGVILVLAARADSDRAVAMTLGIVLGIVTLVYVRNPFGFLFALATAAGFVAAASYLPEWGNDLLLKTVGLTSCMYAILDIKDDVLSRSSIRSDARMLAEATGIPTLMWGLLWILLAVAGSGYFVLLAARADDARGWAPWQG